MGLLDQVLGNALGSRSGQGQGGSSPLMMALMALLASGALNGRGANSGGLGGLLGGLTGGGAGSGSMMGNGMGGGLGGLIESFGRAGHGDIIQSWMGPGQNHDISPNQLGEAIGHGTVDDLSRQTGMARGDLLTELSRILPGVVDQMTPHGRMPNNDEMSRW